ncbi:MAG: pilin [Candidatus Moraniibacteriota bacterium]
MNVFKIKNKASLFAVIIFTVLLSLSFVPSVSAAVKYHLTVITTGAIVSNDQGVTTIYDTLAACQQVLVGTNTGYKCTAYQDSITCASMNGKCGSACLPEYTIAGATDCGWPSGYCCTNDANTQTTGNNACLGSVSKVTGRCNSTDCSGWVQDGVCSGSRKCCVPSSAMPVVPGATTTPTTPNTGSNTAADNMVPGTTASGGIISCGRGGQPMCTLCDLIIGIHAIIIYLLKIAIGLALTIFTVAGVMYIVSVGNSGMIELAKGAMKNAILGFVIILAAWLMINTLLLVIGARTNLGITGVTVWGKFECAAAAH